MTPMSSTDVPKRSRIGRTFGESFDAVLARSLAKMPVLAELTLPFARIGGVVVAQKKGDVVAELDEAGESLRLLGGGPLVTRWVRLRGIPDERALVSAPKVALTPDQYPATPRRAPEAASGSPGCAPCRLGPRGWRRDGRAEPGGGSCRSPLSSALLPSRTRRLWRRRRVPRLPGHPLRRRPSRHLSAGAG